MKRETVDSEALSSIGYDEALQILEVQFREKGVVWQYLNLPKRIYNRFRKAASLGNFFVTHIKGRYPEQRVE
jgi:hypothetical protein